MIDVRNIKPNTSVENIKPSTYVVRDSETKTYYDDSVLNAGQPIGLLLALTYATSGTAVRLRY